MYCKTNQQLHLMYLNLTCCSLDLILLKHIDKISSGAVLTLSGSWEKSSGLSERGG